jgi:hypothetical protein
MQADDTEKQHPTKICDKNKKIFSISKQRERDKQTDKQTDFTSDKTLTDKQTMVNLVDKCLQTFSGMKKS